MRAHHPPVRGAHVDLDGVRHYRIEDLDGMPPFLVALASDSDHWLYISSTGALTAGRRDPDNALFPYGPDDRIHDGADHTGSKTVIRVLNSSSPIGWEPFSPRTPGRVSRSLAKSVWGNQIRFEETSSDLGLTFSYSWAFSERFGFVRRAGIENLRDEPVELDLLDGIQNILPAGITRRFQSEYSTLADGYKKSELDPETGLGLFTLSSIPTDKAEPSESLRATTVFGLGLLGAVRLLSTAQLDRFRDGEPVHEETDVRGRRGAFLRCARLRLGPRARERWYVVAELRQDAAAVRATLRRLREGGDLAFAIEEDIARGTRSLIRLVAGTDGLSRTGDELDTFRHYSNALNNALRGGVPDDGYRISRADLRAFLAGANREVARRHAALLDALPERLPRDRLLALVREARDPDLERLACEYLPITFGRRHGDPSRPWNLFTIAVKDEAGAKVLDYEGNWRDLFQNWEALALSYPGLLDGMIAKFLDCSTADGHNPYHVGRRGFDWEVIDPADPWSFIGYWGDHQVIYLLRLLERLAHVDPEALPRLLPRRLFPFADVPYRIKPYEALLRDPQRTIDFDAAHDRAVRARAARLGADGKLLLDGDERPVRANLAEKLLLVVLARLANYIPGAGIWMNTQRPEWNDANNALVGSGVSMVTLYHLRRFLAFVRPLFAGAAPVELAAEIAAWLRSTHAALDARRDLAAPGAVASDRDRRELLDALGRAASDYRAGLYARGFSGARTIIDGDALARACDLALAHIDATIRANRRDDGLYHAYNLMKLDGDAISLRRLDEMLEGQVAVLGAGVLTVAESIALLDALRASRLYRPDQDSYLLYPDRALPRFLEKNCLPASALDESALLAKLVARGDRRVVVRDVDGGLHFHADLRNASLLRAALDALDPAEYGALVEREREAILALYERVFDHQSFTGRSGTFFKYEGLGCIYWHMVSKLLVAVQEVMAEADRRGDEAARVRLAAHYAAIRAGIGVHKSPAQYGAIPTDPHSHTPSFAGAQQPGMTGQVKEDLLARQGELGLSVEAGRVRFRPGLLVAPGFLDAPAAFDYVDVDGVDRRIELLPGTLAFTTCQVPVIAHRAGPRRIEITRENRAVERVDALDLDVESSRAIFARDGAIRRLDVFFALD